MERLPWEMTSNILSRLPIKCTLRCKCVCKLWCEILSDPCFQFSRTSSGILLYNAQSEGTVCRRYKCYYLEDNEEEPPNQDQVKPVKNFDVSFLVKYPNVLGYCNGLLCVVDSKSFNLDIRKRNPIYVLNPITEEISKIPNFTIPDLPFHSSTDSTTAYYHFLFGFGFAASKKEFKLVAVIFSACDSRFQSFNGEVQVYTLGKSIWKRKPGIVPDALRNCEGTGSQALVNGCLHWKRLDWNYSEDDVSLLIVSFDLGLEEFGIVSSPPLRTHLKQLGVLQGCLCVIGCTILLEVFDIWVMKEYNVKESWVKQCSIEIDYLNHHFQRCQLMPDLMTVRKTGEIVLHLGSIYLVSLNITSQKCSSRIVEGMDDNRGPTFAHPFTGSLISLRSAFGMDSFTFRSFSDDKKLPLKRGIFRFLSSLLRCSCS